MTWHQGTEVSVGHGWRKEARVAQHPVLPKGQLEDFLPQWCSKHEGRPPRDEAWPAPNREARASPHPRAGSFLTLPRPSTGVGDQETVPGGYALAPLPWAALTLAQERPLPSAPSWLSDLLLAWLTASRGEP